MNAKDRQIKKTKKENGLWNVVLNQKEKQLQISRKEWSKIAKTERKYAVLSDEKKNAPQLYASAQKKVGEHK